MICLLRLGRLLRSSRLHYRVIGFAIRLPGLMEFAPQELNYNDWISKAEITLD